MTLPKTSRGLWVALERGDWALSEHLVVLGSLVV